ncbi:MAG: 6-carboxytetrahydropterin synthase [Lachnospiraceae bacterium]|nr:6-carboxytetrahydropterin synthase [Lachnospiraceae bacterium]
MIYKQYKYKFYLNMNHYVHINGQAGAVHSHTWEIALAITTKQEGMISFSDIETCVNGLLQRYQDKCLNNVPPFTTVDPTLENVCDYLYDVCDREFHTRGWILLNMEMSETPTRVYQCSGIRRDDYTFL